MDDKKYNVYVIRIDDFKAVALIGEDLSDVDCYEKEGWGMKRYNQNDYFVAGYEVGTEQELQYRKDIKKLAKAPKHAERLTA